MWCRSAVTFNELEFFFFRFFFLNAQLFWLTSFVVTSNEWMNEYVNSFMCVLVIPWTINRCVKLLYFFLTSLYEWWTGLFFPCNCGYIYDKEPFSHTKDRPPGVIQQVLGFFIWCIWTALGTFSSQDRVFFFSVYVEEMWEKCRGVIALSAVANSDRLFIAWSASP